MRTPSLHGMAEDNLRNLNCIRELVIADFEIPYRTTKEANIAYNTLRIDQEPIRGGVIKELEVQDHSLIVKISAKDIKKLRSAVTSFMDFLILTTDTIARFGYNQ